MSRLTIMTIIGVLVIAGTLGIIYAISQQERDEAAVIGVPSSGPAEASQNKPQQPTGQVARPSFDVVRVNPNGDAVIAGRSTPEAKITLMDGDIQIGETKADARGEWVLLPQSALNPGEHRLTLRAFDEKGGHSESEKAVIILVPEPSKDLAGRPVANSGSVLAIEVPKSGEGASRLLNNGLNPEQSGQGAGVPISLYAIDYDAEGRVFFSGAANSGAFLRLYLDNTFLAETKAVAAGAWSVIAPIAVKPGKYQLRIDEVDSQGKTLSRLVFPFEQADFAKSLQAGGKIVVQPGSSLWRLARRSYGEGVRYTVIYQANKEQIADPDLIYPGQILDIPNLP